MLASLFLLLQLSQSKITVFVVPHSHNDAGWLVDIEKCYTTYCRNTLSNVFDLLENIPSFKFCWAETLFLSMWLKEYPSKIPILKEYIDQGRFEIIGGGWVQNDEALPDFELVLRQIEHGFAYLKFDLNLTLPKIAWQLDPFGHSSLTPSLFKRLGYEALVVARIDEVFRSDLEAQGDLEFIWKGQGFGEKEGIFTHVLNNHYSFPEFIRYSDWYEGSVERCYKYLPASDFDVKRCIIALEKFVLMSQKKYKTNNHLLMLGDDFMFTEYYKATNYISMWKDIINKTDIFEVKFATPSEYFAAVWQEKKNFKVFEGDFLPLVSSKTRNGYRVWTGFYTTKPYLKKMVFDLQKTVRIAEILSAFVLREGFFAYELSACTHHDAITGTSKYIVFLDYLQRLEKEKKYVFQFLGRAFRNIFKYKTGSELIIPYKVIIIFNPLNWEVKKVIHFKTETLFCRLRDSTGQSIESQMVLIPESPEVFFEISLGSTQSKVIFLENREGPCEGCSFISNPSEGQTINNSVYSIHFVGGLIHSITLEGKSFKIGSQLVKYETKYSGAYTFCPKTPSMIIGNLIRFKTYSGKIAQVASTTINAENYLVNQTVILLKNSIELIIELDSIYDSDVFLRFNTNPEAKNWFYTFNSADVMRRSFVHEDASTKGSNYYPINAGLLIDFTSHFLSIYPSFPIGAGMPDEKTFEMGLHRDLIADDGLGIGSVEPDNIPVKHSWTITLKSFNHSTLWKDYLEHKSRPSVFAIKNDKFEVTENLFKGKAFKNQVHVSEHEGILPEDQCRYLSSAVYRAEEIELRVLNICDRPISLGWLSNAEKIGVSGSEQEKGVSLEEDGVIEYLYRNNCGSNVMKYKKWGSGDFEPFELKAFRISGYEDLEFPEVDILLVNVDLVMIGGGLSSVCCLILVAYFVIQSKRFKIKL